MRLWIFFHHFLFITVCSADLHHLVRYFETLDSVNLQVVTRKKRDTDGSLSSYKHINFETLGRKFNMVLFPGSSVIGPDFKARTVDRDGRVETFVVNPNNFYTGFLENDKTVEVDAHYEDGILSSRIYFPHETYVVEPAWRHRLSSSNATMISYRRSDVNWDEIFPIDPKTGKRTRMKDGIRLPLRKPEHSEEMNISNSTSEGGKSRHKRAVAINTCPMITVADFMFFRDMGNKKRGTTAALIISTMQHVNRYYQRTVWDPAGEYTNMGFHINEMLIHTQFTLDPPNHYNADKDWDYNERLSAFSKLKKISRLCLGHLLTSYPFKDNVLGLAYIASESHANHGGICSLRHNWGAEHDPLTAECGPSSSENGKYVMWPYSVPGYDINNKFFSPCSKRYIGAVLTSKSRLCFREMKELSNFCGNGIIEKNEECDPGVLEEGVEDACCTRKCHLRPGATCSDFNHDCCKDCETANATVMCSPRNPLTCKKESHCDGRSLECPQPGNLPDNTSCIDRGECYNGTCLGFCTIWSANRGKKVKPCLCTQNATSMCRRCCAETRETKAGECLPTTERLDAGRTCLQGYCSEAGVCIKVEQKLVERIFNFIKHLSINKLLELVRNNLVGAIILCSLVIWIPASLTISFVDRRNKRQQIQMCSKMYHDGSRSRGPHQAQIRPKQSPRATLSPPRPAVPGPAPRPAKVSPVPLETQHRKPQPEDAQKMAGTSVVRAASSHSAEGRAELHHETSTTSSFEQSSSYDDSNESQPMEDIEENEEEKHEEEK